MTIMYTLRCTVDLINDNKDAYFGGNAPAPTASRLMVISTPSAPCLVAKKIQTDVRQKRTSVFLCKNLTDG